MRSEYHFYHKQYRIPTSIRAPYSYWYTYGHMLIHESAKIMLIRLHCMV